MITPLTIRPDTTVILEPRYYGSIAWYAVMAACGNAVVDYTLPFDKRRKLTHRTTVADVNGPLDLTVPLTHARTDRSASPAISTHNRWWDIHRVTLESAYGRTPYFEYYIDRFLPALTPGVTERFPTLRDLDTFIDNHIRQILGIPCSETAGCTTGDILDLRRHIPALSHVIARAATNSARSGTFSGISPEEAQTADRTWPEYYQVRRHTLGFIPDLSILDLIFNLGPESPLYLHRLLHPPFNLL